jgi:hypothetical protein
MVQTYEVPYLISGFAHDIAVYVLSFCLPDELEGEEFLYLNYSHEIHTSVLCNTFFDDNKVAATYLPLKLEVVTPCGLVGRYRRFGGTYCLHLQGLQP